MARSELLETMDPDSIIRIHSASDEGTACIQAQPAAPDNCFSSLEFKVFIYLLLGIQISKEDVNCPLCTHGEGLSNLHLDNGCKNGDYVHRKHNIIMDQIKKLCTAANLLADLEYTFCFNNRTNKRMVLASHQLHSHVHSCCS